MTYDPYLDNEAPPALRQWLEQRRRQRQQTQLSSLPTFAQNPVTGEWARGYEQYGLSPGKRALGTATRDAAMRSPARGAQQFVMAGDALGQIGGGRPGAMGGKGKFGRAAAGAGQGAAIGNNFGPWGALIGAGVGALINEFV